MTRMAWGLLLSLLIVRSAAANPIRGNTPGTGVFQRSGLLAGAMAEQKEGGGTEFSSISSFVDLRYTPDTHWILGVRVPYLVESRVKGRGTSSETVSGLGDLVVSVKHRFYRWVGPWADRHAAVEVGIKLPSGATDRPVDPGLPASLRSRLQPGTGSTDGLVDIVYQQARRRFVFSADLGYRYNTEGDGGYRQGNETQLNMSASYVLLPRDYTRPGHEVFAVLEGRLLDTGKDRLHGTTLPGTVPGFFLLPVCSTWQRNASSLTYPYRLRSGKMRTAESSPAAGTCSLNSDTPSSSVRAGPRTSVTRAGRGPGAPPRICAAAA